MPLVTASPRNNLCDTGPVSRGSARTPSGCGRRSDRRAPDRCPCMDVHELHAGRGGEIFARHVADRADAGGAVVDLAGIALAKATSSATDFAGGDGCTTSELGAGRSCRSAQNPCAGHSRRSEERRADRERAGVAEQDRVAVGRALRHCAGAEVPPAPPRLSTTICWPRISLILSATVRATTWSVPPGETGTTGADRPARISSGPAGRETERARGPATGGQVSRPAINRGKLSRPPVLFLSTCGL